MKLSVIKTLIKTTTNKTANLKLKLDSLHEPLDVASRGGGDWLEVVSEDCGQVDCSGGSQSCQETEGAEEITVERRYS